MKARRAEEGRGFESLRYNAATQHVGFLLILIGAAIGLATPGVMPWQGPTRARGMTPAEPNAHAPWEAVKS